MFINLGGLYTSARDAPAKEARVVLF